MLVCLRWLLWACVVDAVRFNDRLLVKKPMKVFEEVANLKPLNNKRHFIPGEVDWSLSRPLIRGENGPIATLRNIQESETDARASVQGLTSYDGDIVMPRPNAKPVGYQMPLDADKMPEEDEKGHGPLFDLFRRDSAHAHKYTDVKSSEVTKKDENEKLVRKEIEEKLKSLSEGKDEATKRHQEEEKSAFQEKMKKQNVESSKDENDKNIEIPREKSFVCYLPKIVVKTRLVGTMVVNEVKVYGDPHNEQSVHKFISTHVVSANSSELVNEFVLPPQFILGVPPDIKKSNDISISNAAIYTHNGQLDLSGSPPKPQSPPKPPVVQSRPNYNYVPRLTTTKAPAPTYNPFLPTKGVTARTKAPAEWTGDIISDIIQKKSDVKSKDQAKQMLIWLNNAARHRKAATDVPAGDPNAFTGYEMMPASYLI